MKNALELKYLQVFRQFLEANSAKCSLRGKFTHENFARVIFFEILTIETHYNNLINYSMSDQQELPMNIKKPEGHPEGDFSQCPMFFLHLMSQLNKERGGRKFNDQLIIYPSTSEDEDSEEQDSKSDDADSGSASSEEYESSSEEVPVGKEVWNVNNPKSCMFFIPSFIFLDVVGTFFSFRK